jgi:hypothetical protein
MLVLALAVMLCLTTAADDVVAADNGVSAKKFAIRIGRISQVDSRDSAILLVKDDPGIQKGPAGAPELITARAAYVWENDLGGSVSGCFIEINHRPTPFLNRTWRNTEKSATFRNLARIAKSNIPHTKRVKIVPGRTLKFKALRIADVGNLGAADEGPPTETGGVTVMFEVINGTDGSTHRMCTRFSTSVGSTILYENDVDQFSLQLKLVAKGGVPASCPPWPCGE